MYDLYIVNNIYFYHVLYKITPQKYFPSFSPPPPPPPSIKAAGLVCFYFLENFIPVKMEELRILLHYEHQDEAIDYIKVFFRVCFR